MRATAHLGSEFPAAERVPEAAGHALDVVPFAGGQRRSGDLAQRAGRAEQPCGTALVTAEAGGPGQSLEGQGDRPVVSGGARRFERITVSALGEDGVAAVLRDEPQLGQRERAAWQVAGAPVPVEQVVLLGLGGVEVAPPSRDHRQARAGEGGGGAARLFPRDL